MKPLMAAFLFVIVCVAPVLAQEDCPAIVQRALETASTACADLGRDQACYGNVQLESTFREDATASRFEQQGDRVELSTVASLRLSAMSGTANQWGIALLSVHANLADDSQNVTVVLFGQVNITDANVEDLAVPTATPIPTLTPVTITATGNLNVRGGPSTNDAIVNSLTSGDTLVADGRNADATWLRVQLGDGSSGWVFAQLVTVEGDANALPIAEGETVATTAEPEPVFGPMQSFYFESERDDAPCEEAPDSGILIQTPEGVGQVDMLVNEVSIRLGSTAYVQAQPNGEMTVSVVEGQGQVEALGVAVTVPAGSRVRIPLDANGIASAAPLGPEPYVDAELVALPVVLLPRMITVATALTVEQLMLMPRAGTWMYLPGSTGNDCLGGGGVGEGDVILFEVIVEETGDSFITTTNWEIRYTRVAPGIFTGEYTEPHPQVDSYTLTMTVSSPEEMMSVEDILIAGCNYEYTLYFGYVGETP